MSISVRKLATLFFALVFILSVLGGAGSAAAKESSPAQVTITSAQESFSAGEDVVVDVTITNPGKNTLRVLKWFTPAEDVEEPFFTVSVDGAPVSYLGPTYKRPEPKGDDYITLKAGESLTRSVTLTAYYDFSTTGSYTIRYDTASLDLFADEKGSAKSAGSLTSNELNLKAEGRPAPLTAAITPTAVSGSTSFNKCTTTQQSTLVSARSQASTYAANALSYLTGNKTGSRYTTWFGTVTSARYNTVTNHFTAISSAMNSASVTIDCGCKKKYYAYVYPNQPYTIYVCSTFWTAPLTGIDSKAGTLIHEMSHFNVVASTDDYVYGQSGAKSLAISDPAKAIDNADNHEYFSENTPALP
jgi:peptidyl-Lys metalloendopeptidase